MNPLQSAKCLSLSLGLVLVLTLPLLALPLPTAAQDSAPETGDVRVPLGVYQEMINQLRDNPKPPPAAYAIGKSTILVDIQERDGRSSSTVTVEASIETYENEWTLVPILKHGAALTKVTIDNKPAQLIQGVQWLSWGTNKAGVVRIRLKYNIDAMRSANGFVLPIPIPMASATQITISHPGESLDLAVVPAADSRTTRQNGKTTTRASIPSSSSVLVSWRALSQDNYIISSANYNGKLQGDAINWQATLKVEVFSDQVINIGLLPSTATLNNVTIGKVPATIKEMDGQFVAVFKGRGKHDIEIGFQVEVDRESGPTQAWVEMLKVPVSRFELTLPGKKEISVSPASNVVSKFTQDATVATVYTPMSDEISFSWIDAVPSDAKTELRANANLYHSVYAEEGVLHAKAIIVYDITHGETNTLSFYVPADAQVNQISSVNGGISDWVEERDKGNGPSLITVFLDRKIKGEFSLAISYERLTDSGEQQKSVTIPLLSAAKMHRQRGMLALLAGPELALNPISQSNVTKVGENQLPAFFRNTISMTVAHTFKYTSDAPEIVAEAVAPERKQGKFDAQVDTLISLSEVTIKGSASVQIEVKSGVILDLSLRIPNQVNVLNVAGPSIRTHVLSSNDKAQEIRIEFTQEMQGQFRINVDYEKIVGDDRAELEVPTLAVIGAEVERGRIAIEALTAVELKASQTQQLATLDINELPQQLVLKTSNPILLAFRYVQADPPSKLVLQMTRHQEMDVQVASIENANYQTLVTNDGLAVTTARFWVRNSRQQFLRLALPEATQIWSVFVNNQPEKPANPSDIDAGENVVLIKMINSSTGFPVEVVYASDIEKMGVFGDISTSLPQPDMVVTKTRWDLFMPVGPKYNDIDSNMDIVIGGVLSNPGQLNNAATRHATRPTQKAVQPLRVTVPTEGVHFAFEKLYANRSDQVASVTLRYSSATGDRIGTWLGIAGALLIWGGIFNLRSNTRKSARQISAATLGLGLLAIVVSLGYLDSDAGYVLGLGVLGGVVYLASMALPRIRNWRANRQAS